MHFLWQSQEECEYLINLAKPHMVKSTVVDSDTGKSKDSRYADSSPLLFWFSLLSLLDRFCYYGFIEYAEVICITTHFSFRVRTSSGTFLARGRDKMVRTIEKRIADFTFLPVGMLFTNHNQSSSYLHTLVRINRISPIVLYPFLKVKSGKNRRLGVRELVKTCNF